MAGADFLNLDYCAGTAEAKFTHRVSASNDGGSEMIPEAIDIMLRLDSEANAADKVQRQAEE